MVRESNTEKFCKVCYSRFSDLRWSNDKRRGPYYCSFKCYGIGNRHVMLATTLLGSIGFTIEIFGILSIYKDANPLIAGILLLVFSSIIFGLIFIATLSLAIFGYYSNYKFLKEKMKKDTDDNFNTNKNLGKEEEIV